MKYIISIFLFLTSQISYSQYKPFIIIDQQTNKPIPFCAVDFLNNDGTFSDESGFFLADIEQIKKIKVTHLSYETFETKIFNLPDTIKLNSKPIVLKEIVINKNSYSKNLRVGYYKSKSVLSVVFLPKTEFIVFIKSSKSFINPIIESLEIPLKISKPSISSSVKEIIYGVLQLNIYDNHKNKIYSQIIKVTVEENIKNIKPIKLEEDICFPTEGLFFGIEMIGYVDNQNSFITTKKHEMIAIKFIESKEANQTFYKNIFYSNGDWNLLEKNLNVFHINSKNNFNLGLVLNLLSN
ncbi:MAG: hypothetical protein Q8J84_07610 [Flavobacteriaceae bacterium]|nr:hypothetical protein [Flavobacteriaceae bacterium]